MKKIYFKGYYGYENLGDDIFTITAEWICNNYWVGFRPVFIGRSLPALSKYSIKYETKKNICEKFMS